MAVKQTARISQEPAKEPREEPVVLSLRDDLAARFLMAFVASGAATATRSQRLVWTGQAYEWADAFLEGRGGG